MQEPTHVGFGDNVLTDMIGKIVAEWAPYLTQRGGNDLRTATLVVREGKFGHEVGGVGSWVDLLVWDTSLPTAFATTGDIESAGDGTFE